MYLGVKYACISAVAIVTVVEQKIIIDTNYRVCHEFWGVAGS